MIAIAIFSIVVALLAGALSYAIYYFRRQVRSLRSEVERLQENEKVLVSKAESDLMASNRELRREIEERKKRAEELARSNEDLEQFAFVSSHDLQEPLRMVSSYVQLLAQRYKGKLDSDADEFIAFAVDGAKRMQELINGLLSYSRINTRGAEFKPVDCNEVLKSVTDNLQFAIEESQAKLKIGPLPLIMADRTQIEQIFQNLIGNAVKFRGKDAPIVHVACQKKDSYWQFSVSDNGIGFDMAFAKRIFLIFQRLHSKTDYPGTGIGLAICKKIVERHGGSFSVDSVAGKGSVFSFTIPVTEISIETHKESGDIKLEESVSSRAKKLI